jgi:hypothetical protein
MDVFVCAALKPYWQYNQIQPLRVVVIIIDVVAITVEVIVEERSLL